MLVGAHVSSAGSLSKAIERGASIGAEAIQIFTQSPRQWKPYAQSAQELDAYADTQREHPTMRATFCHATYLINMASANEEIAEKSFACLVENLAVGTAIESSGVVLHVGSHKGAGIDSVIEHVASELVAVLDAAEVRTGRECCPLLIENAAGAGGTVGRSIDEVAMVIDAAGGDSRLGMCLDTQHIFASGVSYDSRAEADALVCAIGQAIGIDRLRCIHLNDSKVELGSNRDRHENLGEGEIGKEALSWLLGHPDLDHVPAVLEVPGDGDGPRAVDVEVARAILARGLELRS